jgi:hypothetical protein
MKMAIRNQEIGIGRMSRALAEEREARELHALLRKQEILEGFRRAGRFVSKWLWVPNLIFILGALAYLGAVYGYVLLDWLGWF